MRFSGVLLPVLAVLVRGHGVLLGFVVPPVLVMVRGHPMMVGGSFVMGSSVVVVFARCVLGFRHEEAPWGLVKLLKSGSAPALAQATVSMGFGPSLTGAARSVVRNVTELSEGLFGGQAPADAPGSASPCPGLEALPSAHPLA